MRNMLDSFHTLLPALLASLLCLAGGAHADVHMLLSTPTGISISYRPDNLLPDTLRVNGAVYLQYHADGHVTTGAPGEPALPARSLLFAAPETDVPTLTVSALSRSIVPGVTLAPYPSLATDKSGLSGETYAEDPVQYALSGFQPAEFARLGKRWTVDGVSVWEITLHPVLFDAHSRTAAVADSMTITVSWSGALAPVARPSRIPERTLNREACIVPDSQRAFKPGAGITNPFATGDWYRIAVSDSGMYSISGSELASKGFPTGTTRVNSVRMYYGGGLLLNTEPHESTADSFREIAIRVRDINGDGYFGAEDSIVFYGEALSRFIMSPNTPSRTFQNHPYSASNIYWVTVSAEGTPKRMASRSDMPSDALTPRTTFHEVLHLESDVTQEYAESGNLWYWYILNGTASKGFSFNAPDIANSDSALVRLSFLNPPIMMNQDDTPKTISHNMEALINDEGPFNWYIPATEFNTKEIRISNPLKEKGNILRIRRTTGNSDETVQLDWVELEYERYLTMPGQKLEFFYAGDGNPMQFTVRNVGKETVEVFDTSDPYGVAEITGKKYDASARTITFPALPPSGKLGRFLVLDPAAYNKVSSISKKNSSDLRDARNGADYIMISNRLFIDEARRLADWRSRDSVVDPLKTLVVDVSDIFDEFGWGVLDPTAIRDFLRFQRDNCSPAVRYCCLVGDTTNRYKNISTTQTSRNYLPTFSHGDVTTDDYFTWDDPTMSPVFGIGRLCVNTVEETKTVVEKIINYERSPENGSWHDRVLLIADDEYGFAGGGGTEVQFSNDAEGLDRDTYIPQYMERMKLMMIEYPMKNLQKPDATEALLGMFDKGCLIATFIGHGNQDLLAHEHLLVGARDIERFNNAGRLPLFIAASCEVGEFDRVDYTSLAEMLQLRKGGGCVAAIAASRETYSYSNIEMVKTFFTNLFDTRNNPEARIGYALKIAKHAYSYDTIEGNNQNRYLIFGDPATRLAIPRFRFSVAPLDTLFRLEKVNIAGNVTSGNKPVPYTGTLHISAEGPRVHKRYVLTRGYIIDYTMPGKVFYRGEIPISGTGFSTSLVVPKDLTSDTKESRIYLFSDGDTQESSGIFDRLAVGNINPMVPEDTAGPDIKVSFDGKAFESGDYVRRQPTISASFNDPSGLNIYGSRGHNVSLTLDKSDVFILTDKVRSIGSYTNGLADYALPQLTPGEHHLELNVYDSYNNVSKKIAIMNVVGSETGEIAIRDLLNYPNPMRSDGTSFTFNLTDDAGSAEIKIYSQSGRLVDTLKFAAEYGFNTVPWKPASQIANGVYFYKLTIRGMNGRKATRTEKMIVMR